VTKKLSYQSKKDFSELKSQKIRGVSKYLLLKEYEIIQQKIDNYGSSDIAYKTLTITLTAAALFASKDIYLGSSVLIITCFIILIILYSEAKNSIYEIRLVNRAQTVEKAIEKNGIIKKFPCIVYTSINDKVLFIDVFMHMILNWYKFIFYYSIILFILYTVVN